MASIFCACLSCCSVRCSASSARNRSAISSCSSSVRCKTLRSSSSCDARRISCARFISVMSTEIPSTCLASPWSSSRGILRVCSQRVPRAVWTGSSAMSWIVLRRSTSRSLATKESACSLGKKSWSRLPINSARGSPMSASPSRLNHSKRSSRASFTNIIAGRFSSTDSRKRLILRAAESPQKGCSTLSKTITTERSGPGKAPMLKLLSPPATGIVTAPIVRALRVLQTCAYLRRRAGTIQGSASPIFLPIDRRRSTPVSSQAAGLAYTSRSEDSSPPWSISNATNPSGAESRIAWHKPPSAIAAPSPA